MTSKETLSLIMEMLANCTAGHPFYRDPHSNEKAEALRNATEAVIKYTAEKAIKKQIDGIDVYCCPCCGHTIYASIYENYKPPMFCRNCGKALSWD